jgi:hypothetical protein
MVAGAAIEFELPRHVACATCGGGGCDTCERSGAITLRGRDEPAEVVRVTLPKFDEGEDPPSSGKRGIVLRIREHGGLPAPESGLPRGTLLLRVVLAEASDPGVYRVRRTEPPAEIVQSAAAHLAKRRSTGVMVLAVAVVLWILFLIMLRMSGLA